MYTKLLITLTLFFSVNSFAQNYSFQFNQELIKLVKVTNDEDNEISYMFVIVDEDKNIKNFGYKTYLDGNEIESKTFSNNLGYAGVVLEARKGRDIVILRGLNVDFRHGGTLEVDFLYNGMTGSRGKFLIELDRTSDAWQLTNQGRIVRHLHLVSNKKPIVGTIGIKKIKILKEE